MRLFPAIAEAYWGECDVEWVPPADRLDTCYGTDAFVRGARGHASVALRLRSACDWLRFEDVTFRYDSLRTPSRQLEVVSATAGVYCYAIADTDFPVPPTRLSEWFLIRYQEALEGLRTGELPYRGPYANGDESSRLVAVSMLDLYRRGLVLARCPKGPVAAPPERPPRFEQLPLRLW